MHTPESERGGSTPQLPEFAQENHYADVAESLSGVAKEAAELGIVADKVIVYFHPSGTVVYRVYPADGGDFEGGVLPA